MGVDERPMRIPAQELETAVIGAPVERPRNQQWVVQAIGSSGIHQIRKAIEQAARMADELASGDMRTKRPSPLEVPVKLQRARPRYARSCGAWTQSPHWDSWPWH